MDLFFSRGNSVRFRFPVTPKSVIVSTPGRNRTERLIDTSEISILSRPGLREISFEALLPNQKYPFAVYADGLFRPASHYLAMIEMLKRDREPFLMTMGTNDLRSRQGFSISVCLEGYSISEDAANGGDTVISLRLKEFRSANLAVVQPDSPTPPKPSRPPPVAAQPKSIVAERGDTLWSIAKRYLGDGSRWPEIFALNRAVVSKPNLIYPGQVIVLPGFGMVGDGFNGGVGMQTITYDLNGGEGRVPAPQNFQVGQVVTLAELNH